MISPRPKRRCARRAPALGLLLTLAGTGAVWAASLQDLADRLVDRSRSHVRTAALREMQGLEAADKDALARLLLAGLVRTDPYERMNAATALGFLDAHARAVRDQLRPLLKDPSDMVRREAQAALGRLGEDRPGAVAAEVADYGRFRGAQDVESRNARYAAIRRLGYVLASEGERPPAGVVTLAEALGDADAYTRTAAARSLFLVAGVACADVLPVTPALVGAVRDADRNTAYLAFRTLEAMGLVRAERGNEQARAASSNDAAERRRLGQQIARDLAVRNGPSACADRQPSR